MCKYDVCIHVNLTFMLLLIYKPSQLYNIFEVSGIFIYIIHMYV